MELRDFTQNDWMGYCGATRPKIMKEVEVEPKIMEFKGYCENGKSGECTVIVDATGIGVHWYIDDEQGPIFMKDCKFEEGC